MCEQDILIRPSTPDDAAAFRECLDAVAREREFLAFVEAPPLADVQRFLADARTGGLVQFLAFSGQAVVGWCDVSRHAREGYRHSGSLGIGVRAGYRRSGLGRRLLRATLAAARQSGLQRIELSVHSSNRAALALYVSEGFREEGVKRAARVRDGRVQHAVIMAWIAPELEGR